MRHLLHSAIVPYPTQAMFDLVADVAAYPQFLSGCEKAAIVSQSDTEVLASLTLRRGSLHVQFITRNRLQRPERIAMELVEGPFSILQGAWEFTALGAAGCRISLDLHFDFASAWKNMMMAPLFTETCNQLVNSFVLRAQAIHGKLQAH